MLTERFREHWQVIHDKEGKEIASHFNRGGHAGVSDMKVMALMYKSNLVSRKLKEQKVIDTLGCFGGDHAL